MACLLVHASKVRATCIIVPYNDGSEAPIWLSERGRSCLAFAESGMFGLGMAPKEKRSHLFKPFSIQEYELYLETWVWSPLISTEKSPCGNRQTDYVNALNFNICLFLIVTSLLFCRCFIF